MVCYLFSIDTCEENNGIQDIVSFKNEPSDELLDQKLNEWYEAKKSELEEDEIVGWSYNPVNAATAHILGIDIEY